MNAHAVADADEYVTPREDGARCDLEDFCKSLGPYTVYTLKQLADTL